VKFIYCYTNQSTTNGQKPTANSQWLKTKM